jgi:L-ectoine synthase
MIVRRLGDVPAVQWGHGISRRLLVATDNMGFSLTDTIVKAGTQAALQYTRHLEACYCMTGTGYVIATADGQRHDLCPGTLYALDHHDAHYLVANPEGDMRLLCVFVPALHGDERHTLADDSFSRY